MNRLFLNSTARIRLFASLAISLILHAAAFFFLQHLRVKNPQSVQGWQISKEMRPLAVTLTSVTRTSQSDTELSVDISRNQIREMKPEILDATSEPATQWLGRGSDTPPSPGVVYYPSSELTKRPQAKVQPDLYPSELGGEGATGKLILKLWIDSTGKVIRVDVEHSELPLIFSIAVANAFRQTPFAPGERNGVRVGAIMEVEVSYEEEN